MNHCLAGEWTIAEVESAMTDNLVDRIVRSHNNLLNQYHALSVEYKSLLAAAKMLDAVTQGAQEEFVRTPYGASHEDVAQINEWHTMAAEARKAFSDFSECSDD